MASAHPVRLKAFTILVERPASPKEIAVAIGEEVTHVAYHVRELERLEVIELVDTAQVRGATQHFYRAVAKPELTDEEWAEMAPDERQSFSILGVQLMISDAARSLSEGTFDKRGDRYMTRTPMQLDKVGWKELTAAYARVFADINAIHEASATRASQDGVETFPVTAALLCFERPPKL